MKNVALFVSLAASLAGANCAHANDSPAIWIDVPYSAQTKDGCGSAAISMVLRYWAKQQGKPESPEMDAVKIQRLLYASERQGIPASAMEKYFQAQGYRTFAFRGEWSDVLTQLEKGRPLIVSLKASGAHGPLHYAVVVGVDAVRGYVFLNDPGRGKMLRMSREGFESEWNSAENWTLLAVPSGER